MTVPGNGTLKLITLIVTLATLLLSGAYTAGKLTNRLDDVVAKVNAIEKDVRRLNRVMWRSSPGE